jgi:superoxide dismutase
MKNMKHLILAVVLILLSAIAHAQSYPFELPKLPYAYNALEPAVDAATMEIHYSKHHAAYVNNLNAALKGSEDEKYPMDELLLYAGEFSAAVRNNAGGHYNHEMFWNILLPGKPFDKKSNVGKAVIQAFGSADSLYKLLNKAGAGRFGSGWAWLYVTPEHQLAVSSTPNQDNPIMDVVPERGIPILGIDVWEHAYYLKYQNKRGDYLRAILDIINWEAVDKNYAEALKSPVMLTIARETWKELAAFHVVMSQTYHPSEEGNLQPIRERSEEFLERARDLQKGKVPALLDSPEIHKSINGLVTGGAELNQMVTNRADDQALTKKLDELHDVFHTIQGLCRHH